MPVWLKPAIFCCFLFYWDRFFVVSLILGRPLENLIFESSSTVDGSEIWFTSWGKCTSSHDLQGFSTIPGWFVWDFVHQQHGSGNTGPLNTTPSETKGDLLPQVTDPLIKKCSLGSIQSPQSFVGKKNPRFFFWGANNKTCSHQKKAVGLGILP